MSLTVPYPLRGHWVNRTGELANPRYIFICDRRAGALLGNLDQVGFDKKDQLIVVNSGLFADAKEFLLIFKAQLAVAKAFVCLWIGQDEISELATELHSSQTFQDYWHPLGPRTVPRFLVSEVQDHYVELVTASANAFVNSTIFSTDPCVMRTPGFGVVRANDVGHNLPQQNNRHHHLLVNRHFHKNKGGGHHSEPGGRYPIHEDAFEDDVIPTIQSWRLVFQRVYAAVGKIMNPQAVMADEAIDALAYVNIRY